MNNLLDESEFTKPYNPWRRFGVFYAIMLLHMVIFFWIVESIETLIDVNRFVLQAFAVVTLLSPLCLGLVMLLGEHKITPLAPVTKIVALLLLELFYYLGIAGSTVYEMKQHFAPDDFISQIFWYTAAYVLINFVVTLSIAFAVWHVRKKRLLLKIQNEQ